MTAACIGTLFTSQSIALGNASMRVLSADSGRYCKQYHKKATECIMEARGDISTESFLQKTEECAYHQENARKCENVVRTAFRNINMSGCPKEIKMSTLCEDEWCHQQDRVSCQKECAGVREQLSLCVHQQVMQSFERNGLEEKRAQNGLMAQSKQ